MLTVSSQRGFWCECWTANLTAQQEPSLLALFAAHSPSQTDRWISVILAAISPTLDASASDEAWERLYEPRIETRRALLRSEPHTASVTHAETRLTWTIRPVLFLPFARHQIPVP